MSVLRAGPAAGGPSWDSAKGGSSILSGCHLSLCVEAEGGGLSQGQWGGFSSSQPRSSLSCPFSALQQGRREGLVCGAFNLSPALALRNAVGQGRCGKIPLHVLLFFLLSPGAPGQAALQTNYHGQNRASNQCLGTARDGQIRLADPGASPAFGRSHESPQLPQQAVCLGC